MSVALASQTAFVRSLDRAATVSLSAYVLAPNSPVVRGLERAGDRGAAVNVELEGTPYGDPPGAPMAAANARVAHDLQTHGVRVHLAAGKDAFLHIKAALVDGTAFLDDRNWPSSGKDTILATDEPGDAQLVAAALAGRAGSNAHLATGKGGALALEAQTIASAGGDRLDVESESFGASAISKALAARAAGGTHVRLIVAPGELGPAGSAERTVLTRLVAAGVDVRVGGGNEKLCVGADRAWAGSANATFPGGGAGTLDWGMQVASPPVVAGLKATFERNWRSAHRPPQGLA